MIGIGGWKVAVGISSLALAVACSDATTRPSEQEAAAKTASGPLNKSTTSDACFLDVTSDPDGYPPEIWIGTSTRLKARVWNCYLHTWQSVNATWSADPASAITLSTGRDVANYYVDVRGKAAGDVYVTASAYGLSGVQQVIVHGLAVGILGPTELPPGGCFYYEADIHGGVPPFTYRWYVDGTIDSGGGPNDGALLVHFEPGDHPMSVSVSDSLGQYATAVLWVHVSGDRYVCTW